MMHRRMRFPLVFGLLLALCASRALLYAAPETPRVHPVETSPLFLPLLSRAPLAPPTLHSAQLVKDIFPGPTSSDPYSLLPRGSGVEFTVNNALALENHLKSNGTAAGTTSFEQLRSDIGLAGMVFAGGLNNVLLFLGNHSTRGAELWSTDRAFNNAMLLAPTGAPLLNHDLLALAIVKNNLFFFVVENDGFTLWKTDGTPAGTSRVSDIKLNVGSSNPLLAIVDNTVFFVVAPAEGKRELWRSDGTSAGTLRIKTLDVNEGTGSLTYVKTQGKTIFFALREFGNNGETTHHLWKTDGTAEGTVRISDVNIALIEYGLALIPSDGTYQYFVGYDASGKIVLWRTDGTSAGTISLLPIGYDEQNHFELRGSTFVNNLNIFLFQDSSGGYQLWRTDGTTKGTFQLHDGTIVLTGGVAQTDKLALFVTQSGTNGQDSSLWRSDGTLKGTFQVLTVHGSNTSSAFINGLRTIGNSVFFRTGVAGEETYGVGYSDGSKAGTHTLTNVDSGGAFLGDTPTIINDVFYFAATDAAHGTELWKADGTNNTLQMVRDICQGSCSSTPDHITAVNNALVFAANDGTHGNEVWRSDGTKDGTTMVDDIQPGSTGSGPNWFTVADSYVFFSAAWSEVGNELWVISTSAVSNATTQAATTSEPMRAAHSNGAYHIALQR